MSKKILEREGALTLESTEAGYLPPKIMVGGIDAGRDLWVSLAAENTPFDGYDLKPTGRYRITVEKLD